MNQLVLNLKKENQDYEFYPTTNEIILRLAQDIRLKTYRSILDIGAGNGKVFKVLDNFLKDEKNRKYGLKKYAIEKSRILLDSLDADVFVLGTDFHTQTLIDKEVDIIFCNPPYEEYSTWAEKIIREGNCNAIFLVIPQRWKEHEGIQKAIKDRDLKIDILGSFDFLNSEDRKARAKVDLLKIYQPSRYQKDDPFDLWFKDNFNIKAKSNSYSSSYKEQENKKETIKKNLVEGGSIVPILEKLYNADMKKLITTYKILETLDSDILKELNVDVSGVKEGLKEKIQGLKNLYWKELFNNLETITSRLTSKSRTKMLDTLTAHTSIDFTCDNAYSVIIWAIKNANKYFDKQLLDIYLEISDEKNIIKYKSNKKLVEDGWRYSKKDQSKYKLDYRLVHQMWGLFNTSSYGDYNYPNGLSNQGHNLLNDIITIAKNLGFSVRNIRSWVEWEPGKQVKIYMKNNNKEVIFMAVRAYKNGNFHLKFNQDFMRAFNIAAGKLNGWLKDPRHCSEELNMPLSEVNKYFKNNNFKLLPSNVKLLSV